MQVTENNEISRPSIEKSTRKSQHHRYDRVEDREREREGERVRDRETDKEKE